MNSSRFFSCATTKDLSVFTSCSVFLKWKGSCIAFWIIFFVSGSFSGSWRRTIPARKRKFRHFLDKKVHVFIDTKFEEIPLLVLTLLISKSCQKLRERFLQFSLPSQKTLTLTTYLKCNYPDICIIPTFLYSTYLSEKYLHT